jgi:hypothetical protein
MSEPVKAPLSATEEAFVAMVLEEHTALVRNADAKRNARMKVLLDEKGVPAGLHVTIDKVDGVAALVYTPTDASATPSEAPQS